ncbi:hypothetical protein HG536_0B04150 [Torulaspora globosa]|uniref:Indoleamine 2,3-dioxygenase n=1 Tax=Torulaspora globosa TaxID=48254 RepID=A0A7G3ZDG5_9SACH|nr:uncharacterized protein HG536_0B04150 [Torulaspora globosa]QLL31551.1 hypothetical protein HG536_0B04150 [Torulaspora globosa]
MSKNIRLPTLEEYGLSDNGFLPSEFPVSKLSDEYYKDWETIVENIPSLLLSKKMREVVDRLPVLDVKDSLVGDVRQVRRAYSVLCFIANAYVWGYDKPCDTLPDCIAKPLLTVSDILGLPPLATYASVVLWNYKPIVANSELVDDLLDLSNLTSINTFTGGMDETWFYLVSVMTEKIGAPCVTSGLKAIQAVRADDLEGAISELKCIAEAIDNLGSVLMKMEAMCDPHIFFFRIRPYLAGWQNMAEVGLPKGVKYGSEGDYLSFAGGSNAQSSLLQALDIVLGIEHFPTGKKGSGARTISANSDQNSFINEMRKYMPREHREFLGHLAKVSNIKDYVETKKDKELTLAYDACIAMLKSFRDKHIQIVTRYIILQAHKKDASSQSKVLRSGLSKSQGQKEQRGTGGTALIPFLKQCRDETGSSAASDWGKKVLSTAVLNVHENSTAAGVRKRSHESTADSGGDAKRMKLGLAGNWNIDQESDEEGSYPAGHW